MAGSEAVPPFRWRMIDCRGRQLEPEVPKYDLCQLHHPLLNIPIFLRI